MKEVKEMAHVGTCPNTVPAVDLRALSAIVLDCAESFFADSDNQRQFEKQKKCEKEEKVECLKRK